jgi:hypothetical protein
MSTKFSKIVRNTKEENQLSGITKHFVETKNGVDFDRTETVVNIHNYYPHIIREGTEINIQKTNKEDGLTFYINF